MRYTGLCYGTTLTAVVGVYFNDFLADDLLFVCQLGEDGADVELDHECTIPFTLQETFATWLVHSAGEGEDMSSEKKPCCRKI